MQEDMLTLSRPHDAWQSDCAGGRASDWHKAVPYAWRARVCVCELVKLYAIHEAEGDRSGEATVFMQVYRALVQTLSHMALAQHTTTRHNAQRA